MKIALACGGTGGHIFPGLATAEVLADRGHDVVLWLAGKDGEDMLVDGWEGPIVTVESKGFTGRMPTRVMGTTWKLMHAARTCKQLMREDPPEVVLGMGSFATVGPVWAAMRLGIPFVLHEANVLPGRAVSLFSRWANAIAGSFEETRYYMKRKDIVLTGMPIREELAKAALDMPERELDPNRMTLLVMGGSRGARALNQIASQAICDCHKVGHKIEVIHLSGQDDQPMVEEAYREAGVAATVHSFTQDMASIYQQADLAICRSGAATCAELSAFGVPALLVPYPYAAKDHQTANARAMEKMEAAEMVPESDLTVSWLKDYIGECIKAPGRLGRMSVATRKRARQRGAESLADLVEGVANGAPILHEMMEV